MRTLKKVNRRAAACEFVMTNVRPADYKSHSEGGTDNGGDCTTRAITYALGGDYREIEARQYEIARKKNELGWDVRRNSNGVWDQIMIENGYRWVQLKSVHTRGELAVLLKNFGPVIALNRKHVAVVKDGKLFDSWDSRNGKCSAFLVKKDYAESSVKELCNNGIAAEVLSEWSLPKLVTARKRTRIYWHW